jgi:Domain of unknown function (DUF4189)
MTTNAHSMAMCNVKCSALIDCTSSDLQTCTDYKSCHRTFCRGKAQHAVMAMTSGRCVATIAVTVVAMLQANASLADGAVAVGLPSDVARDGFAVGHQVNAPDMETARKEAIAGCQRSIGASEKAKTLCKIVATFQNQCFAVAIDPKDGTPGVGWAIEQDSTLAEKEAVAQCRTTAGTGREQFCVVMRDKGKNIDCDGNAK